MKVEDIDFDNILLDKKSWENSLIYDISNKTFIGAKSWHIRFDKIDRVIKIYDGTRYLELFGCSIYNAIYHRINYYISGKRDSNHLIIILPELELIHIILHL